MLKPLFLLAAIFLIAQPQATAPQAPTDAARPAADTVPAEYLRMVNTVKPTAESQAYARKMYNFDCAMCHGANGDGKGEMAAGLKTAPKDLTNPASLSSYTDGELFYIIKNGRGDMLGEGDRLKQDQIWNMVIYTRALARK